MPRITLDEVNRYRKQNGPILTEAEVAEGVAKKAAENDKKDKKRSTRKKKVEPIEVDTGTGSPIISPKSKVQNSEVVDIFADTHELTEKFFGDVKYERNYERLAFEISRLKEELNETIDAVNKGDAAEVVDGIIDLMTFAAGILENFKVDGRKAWQEVHRANMAKEKGTKSTRPNSNGVDLIKPEGWKAPDHSDNVGLIAQALDFS